MDVGIFILVRDRGFRPSSQLSGGMAVAVGDYVLLKPLSGPVKVVQVVNNLVIKVGKRSLKTETLVGQAYGVTLQYEDGHWQRH